MLVVAVLLHEVVVLVMPVKAAERGVRMNKIVANFMAGIVMNMNRNSWFDLTYHGGIAYPWKIPVEHDVRKIASAGSEHITHTHNPHSHHHPLQYVRYIHTLDQLDFVSFLVLYLPDKDIRKFPSFSLFPSFALLLFFKIAM